jgi:hypothetical protein
LLLEPINRGYLILAVNTADTDYILCAKRLAQSIRQWHPESNICLLTDKIIEADEFDIIKLLPYGDQALTSNWKLSNDWQVYEATPYYETIKLEADMWCAGPIDHWWELLGYRNVSISQGCRDFYDNLGTSRFYRKIFDDNDLPDVYNGITYYKKSNTAEEFFGLVANIFEYWDKYKGLLKYPDDIPTTDVVYAVAAKIIGVENVTLPQDMGPTMVHMKKYMIPLITDNWTDELVWEKINPGLRLNTVAQWGLVHYHIKEWANE